MPGQFDPDESTLCELTTQAGIKRDGTVFDGKYFSDGQWVRFRNGRPKKMGGYREVVNGLQGPIRNVLTRGSAPTSNILFLSQWGVQGMDVDTNMLGGSPHIRTPVGFTTDPAYTWQSDLGWDSTGSGNMYWVCHAGRYLSDIADRTNLPVYYGNVNLIPSAISSASWAAGTATVNTASPHGFVNGDSVAVFGVTPTGYNGSYVVTVVNPTQFTYALVANPGAYSSGGAAEAALISTGQSVSGGCVVLHPCLFLYGNDGLISNSDANSLTNFTAGGSSIANTTNVSGQKVVKGLPLRSGGGGSPAGLFWTLEDLIRVAYNPGSTQLWSYDDVSSQSSILSPNSVIEYDGIYYWLAIDRVLMYNGVVREVPNQMNLDFFFDNINMDLRCLVWATKIPRWGEIWWFFPKGDATECNWAIVYNVRENSWYDTPITRSTGDYSRVLHSPLWADSSPNTDASLQPGGSGTNSYRLWQHEFGLDATTALHPNTAIQSFFVTNDLDFLLGTPSQDASQGLNSGVHISKFEPDFKLGPLATSGQMTASILTRRYPNGAETIYDQTLLPQLNFTCNSTEFVPVKIQGRLMRMKFESNIQGGDYMMGRPLLHLTRADERA